MRTQTPHSLKSCNHVTSAYEQKECVSLAGWALPAGVDSLGLSCLCNTGNLCHHSGVSRPKQPQALRLLEHEDELSKSHLNPQWLLHDWEINLCILGHQFGETVFCCGITLPILADIHGEGMYKIDIRHTLMSFSHMLIWLKHNWMRVQHKEGTGTLQWTLQISYNHLEQTNDQFPHVQGTQHIS